MCYVDVGRYAQLFYFDSQLGCKKLGQSIRFDYHQFTSAIGTIFFHYSFNIKNECCTFYVLFYLSVLYISCSLCVLYWDPLPAIITIWSVNTVITVNTVNTHVTSAHITSSIQRTTSSMQLTTSSVQLTTHLQMV